MLGNKIDQMIAALNNVMGVINGKLRLKADKSEVYLRNYLDDPLSTLGANASTANKLKVARTITLGRDAAGSVSFDGSGNVTLQVTIPTLDDKADKVETLTPAQIDARIHQLIGVAPDVLDTFEELAKALGNDPNFAATMSTELAKKANASEVYTITAADAQFLTKRGKAADATLFGGNAPDHYATSGQISTLEQEIADGFTRLAASFNDAAKIINGN
ncbi:TPA: hypothetical protein ACX6NP_000795 [Photobacterium damselae]